MKIAEKLKLIVPANKYMPSIMDEIRQNLARMGTDGISVDIRYDVRTNTGLVRFNFKNKPYEMIVKNQKDVRANMWAIARRIEYKARMHILGIEDFDISVSPYLALENKSGYQNTTEPNKANPKAYATFGISEIASNDDINKKYRSLVKTFHPDMALSEEAKKEFQRRMQEINQAYTEICEERGIT